MLESIFKTSVFYAEKNGKTRIVFASNISNAIKTHTVKVWVKDHFRYINIPCSSGASGVLECPFCRETDKKPDFIFKPRKIYAATVYVKLKEPWVDNNKVSHAFQRKLYTTSFSVRKNTLDPYIEKYGSIKNAKFEVIRGENSKNYNGDIYNLIGFTDNLSATLGEKPVEIDVHSLFSELTSQEIREVFQLIRIAESKQNEAGYSDSGKTYYDKEETNEEENHTPAVTEEEIPF